MALFSSLISSFLRLGLPRFGGKPEVDAIFDLKGTLLSRVNFQYFNFMEHHISSSLRPGTKGFTCGK